MDRDKLRTTTVRHFPDLDKMIKHGIPQGMEEGRKLRIEWIYGFENGCYENWCGKFVVTGPSDGFAEDYWPEKIKWNDPDWIQVSHANLDQAVILWLQKFENHKADQQLDEARSASLEGGE